MVQRLAEEVRAACAMTDVRERIVAMDFAPVAIELNEFAGTYKKDQLIWQRLVKQTGATLD